MLFLLKTEQAVRKKKLTDFVIVNKVYEKKMLVCGVGMGCEEHARRGERGSEREP